MIRETLPKDVGLYITEQHEKMVDKAVSCLGEIEYLHNRDHRHHSDILMLPDGSYVIVRTRRLAKEGGLKVVYETSAVYVDALDNKQPLDQKSIGIDISLPDVNDNPFLKKN